MPSAAHLTLDAHLRPGSQSSVRCISCTKIIELLVFLMVLTFARDRAAVGSKCQNRNTSAAHLTLDTHLRLGSQSSVRCISCTRIIELLVFLMVLTFARDRAAVGSKCQNRNTSAAHLTLDTHVQLGSQSSVRGISCTRIIDLLVFLMVLTFAGDLAAVGSKCQNRNTSRERESVTVAR